MSVGFENTSAALAARDISSGADSLAEPLAVLDTLFSDKDFSTGFSQFLKDQQTDESLTYNQMSDAELMKHLSEYLGSGAVNVGINNSEIELAQAFVEQLYMSDDQLAELDNPVSARAVQAKEKAKQEDRDRDFFQEQAERRLEEHRAQWDATMHKLGDQEYSGAELHEMYLSLQKKENQKAYLEELKRRNPNMSDDEAKRNYDRLMEYLRLQEKLRNNEKLTSAEQVSLNELENDQKVIEGAKIAKETEEIGYLDNANAKSELLVGNYNQSNELLKEKLSSGAGQGYAVEYFKILEKQRNNSALSVEEEALSRELSRDQTISGNLGIASDNQLSNTNVHQTSSGLSDIEEDKTQKSASTWSASGSVIKQDRGLTAEYNPVASGQVALPTPLPKPAQQPLAAAISNDADSRFG